MTEKMDAYARDQAFGDDRVKLEAKCIMGHKWWMTTEQIDEARAFGCAMCPKCGNVATVEKATTTPTPAQQRRRT